MATMRSFTETEMITNSGQTTRIVKQVWNIKKDDEYVKVYTENILSLLEVVDKKPSAIKVLIALLKRVPYCNDTTKMSIYVDKELRQILMKETQLTTKVSLDNCLKYLVDTQMLFRIKRGTYTPNPYIFGRGDSAEIRKLRLSLKSTKTQETVHSYSLKREPITLSSEELQLLQNFKTLLNLAKMQNVPIESLQDFKDSLKMNFGFDKIPEWCWYFVKE